MRRIDYKTLEDLEFPSVLKQVSQNCVTEPGRENILSIQPFQEFDEILPELERVKEFTASFDGENKIPNHGFDPIFRELRLLEIENSSLEISGFRKILTISETTRILQKFFEKFEEFYFHLNSFSEEVNFTSILSEEINKKINKYGEIKDEASSELGTIRRRLNLVKGKINSSFTKAFSQYAQNDYLDEIRESVVENRRVLAVKAMHRKKVRGAVLGSSKTGSIVSIEPQQTLAYAHALSNLISE